MASQVASPSSPSRPKRKRSRTTEPTSASSPLVPTELVPIDQVAWPPQPPEHTEIVIGLLFPRTSFAVETQEKITTEHGEGRIVSICFDMGVTNMVVLNANTSLRSCVKPPTPCLGSIASRPSRPSCTVSTFLHRSRTFQPLLSHFPRRSPFVFFVLSFLFVLCTCGLDLLYGSPLLVVLCRWSWPVMFKCLNVTCLVSVVWRSRGALFPKY